VKDNDDQVHETFKKGTLKNIQGMQTPGFWLCSRGAGDHFDHYELLDNCFLPGSPGFRDDRIGRINDCSQEKNSRHILPMRKLNQIILMLLGILSSASTRNPDKEKRKYLYT
jgi:hypothetical protein